MDATQAKDCKYGEIVKGGVVNGEEIFLSEKKGTNDSINSI